MFYLGSGAFAVATALRMSNTFSTTLVKANSLTRTRRDAMDGVLTVPGQSRKRKRIGYHERTQSARLILDDNLRGHVGVVSKDLWVMVQRSHTKALGMHAFPLQIDPMLTSVLKNRVCVGLALKKTSSSWPYFPVRPSLHLSKQFHGRCLVCGSKMMDKQQTMI